MTMNKVPQPPHLEPLTLPSQRPQFQPQNYVVLRLPFNLPTWNDPPRRKLILRITLIILVIATPIYTVWPSEPDLNISRFRLRRVKIHTKPHIAIDVAFEATVKVENKAVYSMTYKALHVAIGYRGKELGHVTSGGGHLRPWGSSYVDATLDIDGVEVISDWFYLFEDVARGVIELEAVTRVDGSLKFFMYQVPLKAKISCEIDVNINQQTIARQNCYPQFELKANTTRLPQLVGRK